ncbi:MAG: hypothetical protein KJ622_05910 [Alphaproteobacteria bacterium]|nr:hypothetical protein [Alphaproteobacteria bacterium]
MANTILTSLLGAASAFALVTSANAAAVGPLGGAKLDAAPASNIVKVHTSRQVHDMLHGYGYDEVVLISTHGGHYGKPNYKFRACKNGDAYIVDVNWYGDVVDRDRVGSCYGYDDRGGDERGYKKKWRRYRDRNWN